jgi:hypothetical protein
MLNGRLRIYYTATRAGEQKRGICVAESGDGGNSWQKPSLGQIVLNGRDTNGVRITGIPDDVSTAGPCVITMPDGRYRMYFWLYSKSPERTRYLAAESRDGLKWQAVNFDEPCLVHHHDGIPWVDRDGPAAWNSWRDANGTDQARFFALRRIRSNDCTTVYPSKGGGYDMDSVWLLPLAPDSPATLPDNLKGFMRVIQHRTSDDGLRWSEPVDMIIPQTDDPPDLQFYYLTSYPLLNLRIGFLGHYRVVAQTMDAEFTYSEDGRQWVRPLRSSWFPRGPEGSADSLMVYMPNSLIDQGSHWLAVYTAAAFDHHEAAGKAPYQLHGLRIPRFRFAGLRSIASDAILETKVFVLTEPQLVVDADIYGSLKAELSDPFGKALPGYRFEESIQVTGNSSEHRLAWKGTEVIMHRFDAVRLRLRWTGGTLYGVA